MSVLHEIHRLSARAISVTGVAETAIIGVGQMGAAMWRRLREQGIDAVVVDANAAATAGLAAEGARTAADPATACATAGTVVLSLPTSVEVETVALGPRGIIEGAAPGTLILDLTSGVPSMSRRIGHALVASGMRYLDIGVSGGVGGARAGALKAMAGGSADDLAAARAVLDLLAARVWHCGPVGAGHLVKTLLNQSNQAKLMVELEALTVATKAGLDPRLVGEVLDTTVWNHWLFGAMGRQTVGFALALACKDLDIALRVAAEEGVSAPVSAAAQQALRLASSIAGPGSDLIDSVGVWEKANNITIE